MEKFRGCDFYTLANTVHHLNRHSGADRLALYVELEGEIPWEIPWEKWVGANI